MNIINLSFLFLVTTLQTPTQVQKELDKPGPVVLYYYTTWCPSCKDFEPVYKKLSKEMTHIRFYKMDLDKIQIKEHGDVEYIPRLYIGKDGKDLRLTPCREEKLNKRNIDNVRRFIEDCLK